MFTTPNMVLLQNLTDVVVMRTKQSKKRAITRPLTGLAVVAERREISSEAVV